MDVTYNNSYINFNIENEKGFNIQFPTDLDLNITYRKTDNSVTGKHVVFPCNKSSYTIDTIRSSDETKSLLLIVVVRHDEK